VKAARGPTIATVASALACLGAALVPWLRTGEATRSAFGLARSASVLGLFDGAPRRICLALWYLLPFLVAATWTAAAAGKPLVAAAIGGIVGATSLAAGILVIVLAKAEPGPIAAIAAGSTMLISATFLARRAIALSRNHG
jgi:hypothetical protein